MKIKEWMRKIEYITFILLMSLTWSVSAFASDPWMPDLNANAKPEVKEETMVVGQIPIMCDEQGKMRENLTSMGFEPSPWHGKIKESGDLVFFLFNKDKSNFGVVIFDVKLKKMCFLIGGEVVPPKN